MYGDQQAEGNSDIVRSLVTYLALGLGHQAQLAAWAAGPQRCIQNMKNS